MSNQPSFSPCSQTEIPSARTGFAGATIAVICLFLAACTPTTPLDDLEVDTFDFDLVCDLLGELEADLVSDKHFDSAGDEFADEITQLFVEDQLGDEVIEAIWRSATVSMALNVIVVPVAWADTIRSKLVSIFLSLFAE